MKIEKKKKNHNHNLNLTSFPPSTLLLDAMRGRPSEPKPNPLFNTSSPIRPLLPPPEYFDGLQQALNSDAEVEEKELDQDGNTTEV